MPGTLLHILSPHAASGPCLCDLRHHADSFQGTHCVPPTVTTLGTQQ